MWLGIPQEEKKKVPMKIKRGQWIYIRAGVHNGVSKGSDRPFLLIYAHAQPHAQMTK
ncbi:hypothetical protein EAE96_010802 [Botrytis aclada]|nr:hypothetical protein EAE96_010802 [Botrytis aclada]